MPLTEMEKLKQEQMQRMEAMTSYLDDKLSAVKTEVISGIMAHTHVIARTAYEIGRLEEKERHDPTPTVDMERYRRNAQGTPGDGTEDPCTCGHQYHRHFDWGDDYCEGCKYCPCQKFTEPTKVGLYGGRDK